MNTKPETIGERIKQVRKDAKKNQKDFGEEFGISQSHISNIEKGADNPSYTLIKFICSKYDVNEEWLANGNGSAYVDYSFCEDDDTYINKYLLCKKCMDKIIEMAQGDRRVKLIESVECLEILLYPQGLSSSEKEDEYILYLYNIMDNLERLMKSALFLKSVNGKKIGKIFIDEMMCCEKTISEIETNARKMFDIYLEPYDTRYRLFR